jgi:hypothetical protein
MVRAGLHYSLRMSRQMFTLLLMFGWKTLVLNATLKTEANYLLAYTPLQTRPFTHKFVHMHTHLHTNTHTIILAHAKSSP